MTRSSANWNAHPGTYDALHCERHIWPTDTPLGLPHERGDMQHWSPLGESPTCAYWMGRDTGENGGKRSDNPFAAHQDAEMA